MPHLNLIAEKQALVSFIICLIQFRKRPRRAA